MKEIILELTWLDIFFILTTLVSLGYNLYQYLDSKRLQESKQFPIKNGLNGLFNSIKANDYAIFSMLTTLEKIKKNLNTNEPIWIEQSLTSLMQINASIKEAIVALLVTINPEDKTGKEAFRASEYGLTEYDLERKKRFMENSFQIK